MQILAALHSWKKLKRLLFHICNILFSINPPFLGELLYIRIDKNISWGFVLWSYLILFLDNIALVNRQSRWSLWTTMMMKRKRKRRKNLRFTCFSFWVSKAFSFQSLLKAKPPITEDDFKEDFQRQVKHLLCNTAPVSVLVINQ